MTNIIEIIAGSVAGVCGGLLLLKLCEEIVWRWKNR